MQTIYFKNKPSIIATASISGPKEKEGSIGAYFDLSLDNDMFGEDSYEKAECKMLTYAIDRVIEKAKLNEHDIDTIISGDLLNQIISATFSARNFPCGYLGVYNACATFTESLLIGATLIDGGYLKNVVCGSSSHFSSAERQYRYPLELGSTRPPQSQWTVTGAGTCLLSNSNVHPKITCATIGKITDYGVVDANNMGAAMAPSARDTLITHLNETNLSVNDYDMIITGDLGALGSRIFKDLMWEKGFDVEKNHIDCGEIIYNICEQEYQGGSGAGCSALVFTAYIYRLLERKKIKKVLLMSTGALLSSVSSQQGESIPGITHAVVVES